MHGNRKHQKLHSKLIGYINLLKRVFNGVKPIHCYLKRNQITPLFSLRMAKYKKLKAEYRRIANQIVEESMIIANILCRSILSGAC